MASLLRTTIVMTEEIGRVLKQSQLSCTGYLILITLQMSRDQSWPSDQSWPLGQLGKALLVHPTTITMAVDQLEKARLVQRTRHPSDRRTILARLTPDGHQTAGQATLALAGVGYGLADISETTASRITADLRKVRQAAGDLG